MTAGIRLTMEELKNRLAEINPNIEIISDEYKNVNTPLYVKCLICNNKWEAKPCHLLRGHGCTKCYKKKVREIHKNSFFKKINKDITIMSEYNGSSKKIFCKCKKCEYEWSTLTQTLLSKHGCPNCGLNIISEKDYESRLKEANTHLKLIGEYYGMIKPTNFKCLKCGCEYETTPGNALRHGCRKCYEEKRKMTLEEFLLRLSKQNNNISYIDGFKNAHSKVKVQCLKCKYDWETTAEHLLGYTGCPSCKKSHGEEEIKRYLERNKIEYQWQKKFNDLYGDYTRRLSYDFYLPKYNLLIEYQGKQHYFPIKLFGGKEGFKRRKKYDNKKRLYAKNNNINLLEINYNDNVEEKLNIYFKTKSRND